MICKHKSTKLNSFQVLLCITNNSIKHQSFAYIQLNDQTVLFQTIQFSISHLFALSLNVKQFYLTHRQDYQVLPLQARVDLRVMAIKGYSTFTQTPALLEPHHQIVQCHIQHTCWGSILPLCRDAVSVFYSPSQLGFTTLGQSGSGSNDNEGVLHTPQK